MLPSQLAKLQSAVAPVSTGISANFRVLPQITAPNTQKWKTNPPRPAARSGPKPFSPRQLRAIELLVNGRSARAVARELKMSDRTIRTWNHDPRFIAEAQRRARELERAKTSKPAPRKPAAPPWETSANFRVLPRIAAP